MSHLPPLKIVVQDVPMHSVRESKKYSGDERGCEYRVGIPMYYPIVWLDRTTKDEFCISYNSECPCQGGLLLRGHRYIPKKYNSIIFFCRYCENPTLKVVGILEGRWEMYIREEFYKG